MQGFAPEVGWTQLAEAAFALKLPEEEGGIPWIATNTDWTIPQARGVAPGNGTLVSAVHTAIGRLATVAGKPEVPIFEEAVARFGARHPLFLGDRLDTDILGANRAGIPSALVLTGIDRPKHVLAAPAGSRPTFILGDLRELHEPYPEVRASATAARRSAAPRCGSTGPTCASCRPGTVPIDLLRAGAAAIWATGRAIYGFRVPEALYADPFHRPVDAPGSRRTVHGLQPYPCGDMAADPRRARTDDPATTLHALAARGDRGAAARRRGPRPTTSLHDTLARRLEAGPDRRRGGPMTSRLDAALAARGLARSRTHAATLIADGLVTVDGRPVVKASTAGRRTTPCSTSPAPTTTSAAPRTSSSPGSTRSASTSAAGSPSTWAPRPADSPRCCASAAPSRVIAVDVGHGQLAASVALDDGVISIEGFNVRYMTPESLAEASGIDAAPTVVTGDLSFISLTHVLPAARAVAAPDADLVLLDQAAVRGRAHRRQGRTRDGCRDPRRRRGGRAVGGVGPGSRHAAASSPPRSSARTAMPSTSRISRRDAGAIRQNG